MSKRRNRHQNHDVNWADVREAQAHAEFEPERPPAIERKPWIEDWQTEWAATTMDVVQMAGKILGIRYYPNDPVRRDDMPDWLMIKAQELANKYKPKWHFTNPERAWGAYLWASLQAQGKWHWASTFGSTNNEENRAAARRTSSIDALLHQAGPEREQHIHGMATSLTAYHPIGPEAYVLLMENLTTESDSAFVEKDPNLCIEVGCKNQRGNSRRICEPHVRLLSVHWGSAAESGKSVRKRILCTMVDCVEWAIARSLCNKHYLQAKNDGTLAQYGTRNQAQDCPEQGCTKKAPAGGLCKHHTNMRRIAAAPPCIITGCDQPPHARKLCRIHYRQWQLGALTVDGLPRFEPKVKP